MLALCLTACGLPDVIWEGELVDYAASPEADDKLCAGTFERVDRAALTIADRIGHSRRPRFTYYWMPEGLDASPCDERVAGGCASRPRGTRRGRRSTYSLYPVHDHEVAHIYAGVLGDADPFLEEGLAEYLGGFSLVGARGDPTALYGHPERQFDPTFYAGAGRFVAGIVAKTSLERVLALYRASTEDDSPADFEAKLEAHTGLLPSDITDDYTDEASCPSLSYREDPLVCADVPLLLNAPDGDLEIHEFMGCDDELVSGRQGALERSFTVRVAEPAKFEVSIDPDSEAVLTSCEPGCKFGGPIWLEYVEPEDDDDDAVQHIDLPAGLYGLRVFRRDAGYARIEFRP
ncbi:MAG: hypothetical protein AAF721_03870 [Myxococcota bacterium]